MVLIDLTSPNDCVESSLSLAISQLWFESGDNWTPVCYLCMEWSQFCFNRKSNWDQNLHDLRSFTKKLRVHFLFYSPLFIWQHQHPCPFYVYFFIPSWIMSNLLCTLFIFVINSSSTNKPPSCSFPYSALKGSTMLISFANHLTMLFWNCLSCGALPATNPFLLNWRQKRQFEPCQKEKE